MIMTFIPSGIFTDRIPGGLYHFLPRLTIKHPYTVFQALKSLGLGGGDVVRVINLLEVYAAFPDLSPSIEQGGYMKR